MNPYPRNEANDDEVKALIGKSLGQFRIVERIGAGGMATVFKAYQTNLDRYVAIKVLPSHYAREETFVKRFVQEAKSVAKLAHPNIVQIHDFGEHDGITYIVMEYVDGGTLKDKLKQQRALPVPEAVDFMIQAAEGLDCAHRNGIVHRDVKPANMLLRKDGYLLLSDFGIAKILEATTNLTRAGTIGTPQYMSPEQGTGQSVDRRSDIYSLGIVLYHCLTGRVPFTAENPLTITLRHVHDPLPLEPLQRMVVPPPIEQVVLKMTAKAPPDRYQSADALIDALTAALAASNLAMPRHWRGGISSMLPALEQQGGFSGQMPPVSGRLSNVSQPLSSAGARPSMVRISCFRCGAENPSTQLYCTSCGYELSNSRASADRYLGPNGRPVLARLTIQNGPMTGRSYLFHQELTTIGRTNGNDLIISGRTVSRRHARMWFDKGRWYIDDLQSANGTFVNNVRIQANSPVQLNDGDRINFGDEVVMFNITY